MNMYHQTTTQQKRELLKNPVNLLGYQLQLLSLVCLLSFLVFHPSPSNAQQGVNSNTITSGTEVTTITGESTSEIVTNEDGSETTTTTTPITTITTTTTVTQTEVDNVVQNPNFTNEFGGGSSTDWNLESCGGDGCRFGPTHGFMTSHGEGSISQTHSATDLISEDMSLEEATQGMTFSFGADVNNTFRNQIGGDYSQGGTTDSWSITLEIFDSQGTTLGEESIGVTGGANIGDTYQTNQTETGTLHIDSGILIDSGTITITGIDNGYWAGYYGPRFQNIFTTFLYNEIEREIVESLTYEELISTVSCEILNTCVTQVTDILTEDPSLLEVSNEDLNEIESLPEFSSEVQPLEVASFETTETLEIQPMEFDNELGSNINGELAEGTTTRSIYEESTTSVQNDLEQRTTEETTRETEKEVSEKESNSSQSKETSQVQEEEEKESTNNGRPNRVGDSGDSKTDDKRDNKNKSTERKEVKQKVASKMVKDMGDKGRYEGENQLKTLVIMAVLGDTKTFFDSQRQIPDTKNFFTSDTIPDSKLGDNTAAAYYLIGGSSSVHNDLVNSQYK